MKAEHWARGILRVHTDSDQGKLSRMKAVSTSRTGPWSWKP
jgi:hypothetical protein